MEIILKKSFFTEEKIGVRRLSDAIKRRIFPINSGCNLSLEIRIEKIELPNMMATI